MDQDLLKEWARYKNNPTAEGFSFLMRLKETALKDLEEAKKKALEEVRAEAQKNVDSLFETAFEVLQSNSEMTLEEFLEEAKVALETHKSTMAKGDRGDDGIAPTLKEIVDAVVPKIKVQPGKPGNPGKNGTSIKKSEIKDMVEREVGLYMIRNPQRIPTEKEIIKIAKSVQAKFDLSVLAGPIARALENLPYKQKLDYDNGLKNKPGTPAYKESKKSGSGMRGGGDIVQTYDLSTFTDGLTKTFTVPVSTKALMVMGSDFPSILLLGNGFTLNSTRTQITLTAANAPSSGSQLAFMYTT